MKGSGQIRVSFSDSQSERIDAGKIDTAFECGK
jgi:hypothetical protein